MRKIPNERLTAETSVSQPERKCILSGEHGARDTLIRLAVSPPGPEGACIVLPDALARAPGRGAWIGVSRGELETALAKGKLKGALMRAFGPSLDGGRLDIPEDLGARIEAALVRALTDRLGLEMKGGRLLLGSDRIAEQARMGRVRWLAHAADASPDGARKLDQAWRVGSDAEGSGMAGLRLPLDRAALSVALGRDNVVHLALTDPAAARRIAATLQRLLHFQGQAEATDKHAGNQQAAGGRVLDAATPDHDRA